MDEDLVFSYIDTNGVDVKCRIISSFPKNADEIYVLFIEGEDVDENTEMKYGIIVKNNEEFELRAGVSAEEFEELKNVFHEDLYRLAKDIIENQ